MLAPAELTSPVLDRDGAAGAWRSPERHREEPQWPRRRLATNKNIVFYDSGILQSNSLVPEVKRIVGRSEVHRVVGGGGRGAKHGGAQDDEIAAAFFLPESELATLEAFARSGAPPSEGKRVVDAGDVESGGAAQQEGHTTSVRARVGRQGGLYAGQAEEALSLNDQDIFAEAWRILPFAFMFMFVSGIAPLPGRRGGHRTNLCLTALAIVYRLCVAVVSIAPFILIIAASVAVQEESYANVVVMILSLPAPVALAGGFHIMRQVPLYAAVVEVAEDPVALRQLRWRALGFFLFGLFMFATLVLFNAFVERRNFLNAKTINLVESMTLVLRVLAQCAMVWTFAAHNVCLRRHIRETQQELMDRTLPQQRAVARVLLLLRRAQLVGNQYRVYVALYVTVLFVFTAILSVTFRLSSFRANDLLYNVMELVLVLVVLAEAAESTSKLRRLAFVISAPAARNAMRIAFANDMTSAVLRDPVFPSKGKAPGAAGQLPVSVSNPHGDPAQRHTDASIDTLAMFDNARQPHDGNNWESKLRSADEEVDALLAHLTLMEQQDRIGVPVMITITYRRIGIVLYTLTSVALFVNRQNL